MLYVTVQDSRIANTPFHALNMREREIFKARRQLLSMMRDLLRRTAGQREAENLEREQQLTLNGQCKVLVLLKATKYDYYFEYDCKS